MVGRGGKPAFERTPLALLLVPFVLGSCFGDVYAFDSGSKEIDLETRRRTLEDQQFELDYSSNG